MLFVIIRLKFWHIPLKVLWKQQTSFVILNLYFDPTYRSDVACASCTHNCSSLCSLSSHKGIPFSETGDVTASYGPDRQTMNFMRAILKPQPLVHDNHRLHWFPHQADPPPILSLSCHQWTAAMTGGRGSSHNAAS